MYQGTTPTIVVTVKNQTLDECTVFVTIQSGTRQITKTGNDLVVSGSEVAVRLTQQDTLSLFPGQCELQVRWIDSSENAMESDIVAVNVSRALLKQIIKYQEANGNG